MAKSFYCTPSTKRGDNHFKFGKTIYVHPHLNSLSGSLRSDLTRLFSLVQNYQDEIVPSKF